MEDCGVFEIGSSREVICYFMRGVGKSMFKCFFFKFKFIDFYLWIVYRCVRYCVCCVKIIKIL